MREKEKTYRVEFTISVYHEVDEGFYSIKKDLEVANGKEQLLQSIELVKKNIVDYTNRRIKKI